MIGPWLLPLVVVLSFACGAALFEFLRLRRWIRRSKVRTIREARTILKDARRSGRAQVVDAELKAKEILLEERRQFIDELETSRKQLTEKERLINTRIESLNRLEAKLVSKNTVLDKIEHEVLQQQEIVESKERTLETKLYEIGKITVEEAREVILQDLKERARREGSREAQELYQDAIKNAETRAREVILKACERLSRSTTGESSCMIALPNDEMKGRIIGRDGRNVRAFEAIAGVDVLLDEVPEQVVISSHSPERREIAKEALLALIVDGRIQPSRIEEFISKARQDIEKNSLERGKEVFKEIGLEQAHDEVAGVLGRLKFRTSYTQNVLLHSIETAYLAGMIASELKLNQEQRGMAMRAALLHDIGKALRESELSHALAGAQLLKNCAEPALVVNAVAAHHNEVPDESIIAPIVRVADTLSGARPGARREDMGAFITRLQELEAIATNFPGVDKAYALQAGRELHVLVKSADVSDSDSFVLAQDIASKIESEARHRGAVKITVVRETRAITHAN